MTRWPVSGSIHSRGGSFCCALANDAVVNKSSNARLVLVKNLKFIFSVSVCFVIRASRCRALRRRAAGLPSQPPSYMFRPASARNEFLSLEEHPDTKLDVTWQGIRPAARQRSEIRVVSLPDPIELEPL